MGGSPRPVSGAGWPSRGLCHPPLTKASATVPSKRCGARVPALSPPRSRGGSLSRAPQGISLWLDCGLGLVLRPSSWRRLLEGEVSACLHEEHTGRTCPPPCWLPCPFSVMKLRGIQGKDPKKPRGKAPPAAWACTEARGDAPGKSGRLLWGLREERSKGTEGKQGDNAACRRWHMVCSRDDRRRAARPARGHAEGQRVPAQSIALQAGPWSAGPRAATWQHPAPGSVPGPEMRGCLPPALVWRQRAGKREKL